MRGRVVITALLVAAALGAGVSAATPTDALPIGTAIVSDTGSMAPTYDGGELVVYLERPSYQEGDVVVYQSEALDGDPYLMHRVVGIESEDRYVTQGDAYPQTDVYYHGEYATERKIVGEVVFKLDL